MNNLRRFQSGILFLGLAGFLAAACSEDPVVSAECEYGLSACEDGCFDLNVDEEHCGDCDNLCADGQACLMGACGVCPEFKQECYGECVDLLNDPGHCGGCPFACPDDQVCLDGHCTACTGDEKRCGWNCVDPKTNPLHCGDCMIRCDEGETCVNGRCE